MDPATAPAIAAEIRRIASALSLLKAEGHQAQIDVAVGELNKLSALVERSTKKAEPFGAADQAAKALHEGRV